MQNRYPLWKYVLLIVVLIFGVLYAIPNLYGDDPAIQISGQVNVPVDNALKDRVANILQKDHLAYRDMTFNTLNQSTILVVRFNDTDIQLQAKDVISQALGASYNVAPNFVAAEPKFLAALGAYPMKYGLDLRGGVHFLMQADIQHVIDKRETAMITEMKQALRKQKLRYSGVRKGKNGIVLHFRNDDVAQSAKTLLTRRFPELLFEIDTSNGTFILNGTWLRNSIIAIEQSTLQQIMTVIRNRINQLGVAEPHVQQQGLNRVSIDLPGIQDASQAKAILGKTATLEFHMVDGSADTQAILSGAQQLPPGTGIYYMNNNGDPNAQKMPVILYNQAILTGQDLVSATSSFDQQSGSPSVNLTISGSDVAYFSQVTQQNIGKSMAVVYVETKDTSKMVNGKKVRQVKNIENVINVATIQSALGNNFQITGLSNMREAQNLALLLKSGTMPTTLSAIAESTVGPSLGAENIHKGMVSVVVGFILIILFMAAYYRLFGIYADLALALNLILTIAVMSLIGATLTLPGIAGMVLTVGMAVDANVLINERIREELRNGMSPQAAIFAGYERAFSTIVDSNVTTLIVAVVLFIFGSGAVKGFAITLTIGLLISMFTAIVGTRGLVNLTYGNKSRVEKLSIGI